MKLTKHGKTDVKLVRSLEHKVEISNLAWREMSTYTELCSNEVGWLGFCRRKSEEEPLTIVIEGTILPKQNTHGTTTEIQPEHMMELFEDLSKEFGEAEAATMLSDMNLWGHSHVNMSPSPSGQDDSTFKRFIEGGKPFFVRLIMNKSGELSVDVADSTYNLYTQCASIQIEEVERTKVQIPIADNTCADDIEAYMPHGIQNLTLTNIGDELVLVDTVKKVVFRGVTLSHAEPYIDTLKEQISEEIKEKVLPMPKVVYPTQGTTYKGYGGATTYYQQEKTAYQKTTGVVMWMIATWFEGLIEPSVMKTLTQWYEASKFVEANLKNPDMTDMLNRIVDFGLMDSIPTAKSALINALQEFAKKKPLAYNDREVEAFLTNASDYLESTVERTELKECMWALLGDSPYSSDVEEQVFEILTVEKRSPYFVETIAEYFPDASSVLERMGGKEVDEAMMERERRYY